MAIGDCVGGSPTTGRVSSIGGTAVRMSTTPLECKRGLTLVPDGGNNANVYFGGPNITANAADATDGCLIPSSGIHIKVENVSDVYLISDGSNQVVFWAAL